MNPHLKEAILKQKMRRAVRRATKSRSRKNILQENLYATFVEPFADVLQAVNLGAQEFLNSYITYLRLWITWDPEKGNQLLADHDKRRAELAAKWKPLMDKTDQALATGDADIIALTLAPQVWALSAVGAAANEYAGTASQLLNTAGVGSLSPFSDDMSDYKPDENAGSGILDKLTALFFGAAVVGGAAQGALDALKDNQRGRNQNESVLKEQASSSDIEADLKQHFDATGIGDELKEVGSDLFDLLKDDVAKFEKVLEKSDFLIALDGVASFEEFNDLIDDSSPGETADTGENIDPAKLKSELEKSVKSMVDSEPFVEKAKEALAAEGIKDPKDDDIKKFAQRSAFLDIKKKIEDEVGNFQQAANDLKSQLASQVKELLPSEEGLQMLRKGKVTEVVAFVENVKKKFNIS